MRVPSLQGPQIQEQTAPRVRVSSPVDTSVAQTGQALQQVGRGLDESAQHEFDLAVKAQTIGADTSLGQWSDAALYDQKNGALYKQGMNAFDLPNQVLPQFDAQAKQIEEAIPTEKARTIFRQAAQERRSRMTQQLNDHEYQQRHAVYDQTDEASIKQSVDAASLSGDPAAIDAELSRQASVITLQAQRKGWSEVQRSQEIIKARAQTYQGVVSRLVQAGDDKRATDFLNAHIAEISAADGESLQRRLLAVGDERYQQTQRQKKLDADEASKTGDKLFAKGQLTGAWIEANRKTLDAADYRYFYQKLRGGGEGERDNMVYADLRERAGTGVDVRPDARTALQSGKITAADFDRIVGESEQQRPGWYKRGKDYISTSAAVSDLNPDPAAAQRKARMLDDWDEWAIANPKATDDQARKQWRSVVSEYALIDLDKIAITKRMPTFLQGTRRAPDLDKTEAETVKALEDGRIDKAEFDRQAQRIEDLRDTMHRMSTKETPTP